VGRAPVSLFRKLGIPLALGTDSLASNDSLSLWDEMRYALETFPKDLSARDVLRMVTIGAASALKISGSHGSLHAGMRADFQVVEISGAGEKELLERIVQGGFVRDVYAGGVHFIG